LVGATGFGAVCCAPTLRTNYTAALALRVTASHGPNHAEPLTRRSVYKQLEDETEGSEQA